MSAPAARKGACWYRPTNAGRFNAQIAAQRFISDLMRDKRIDRGERAVLEVLAKFVDAKRTTQKSIAFLAEQVGVKERTVQRHLRKLCPSKKKNPEAWARRVLTRRFIHAVAEPGKQADNVPSWFTIETPPEYTTARPRGVASTAPRNPAPRQNAASERPASMSPGGVQNVTQAVIIGSGSTEISRSLHPSTNLGPVSEPSASVAPLAPVVAGRPTGSPPPPSPVSAVPPPNPRPAGGADRGTQPPSLLVMLCARLFPSHAPIAHRAVARLQALGWTDDAIATYLRRASNDPNLSAYRAHHPLLTAVWLAEKSFRTAPQPKPPEEPRETPPPLTHAGPGRATTTGLDARLAEAIERAKTATRRELAPKRRLTPDDFPDRGAGGRGPSPAGGDEEKAARLARARRALDAAERKTRPSPMESGDDGGGGRGQPGRALPGEAPLPAPAADGEEDDTPWKS
jgi:hypothetical protein